MQFPTASAEETKPDVSKDLEARVLALEALVVELRQALEDLQAGGKATDRSSPFVEAAGFEDAAVEKADREDEEADVDLSFERTLRFLPSVGRQAAWLEPSGAKIGLRAFIDLEYIDAGPDGFRDGVSTFDNHHVQVFLDSQLTPRLSAHAEIEWEHAGDVVEIDNAYMRFRVSESLRFDIGRFYTPFGIERFVWYSPTNSLVSRPEAFRRIMPNNFYADGVKAWGATRAGKESIFNWELSLSNGLGGEALDSRRGSRQTRDNNSDRAVSGRLGLAFSPYFEIGASGHTQRFDDDGSGFDQDLTYWGGDLAFRRLGFEVRAEWIQAELDDPLSPQGKLVQRGWYSQLAYSKDWDRRFLPSITWAMRIDGLDLDDSRSDDDFTAFSVALNVEVIERFRLKGEYQWFDQDGPELDDDRVLLQAVIDF